MGLFAKVEFPKQTPSNIKTRKMYRDSFFIKVSLNLDSKDVIFRIALRFLYIVMKSDEGFADMLDKTILIQYQYENVIRFPNKNTLNTEIKQN